ncbi:methyl-accepting chemotaxis protein [Brachyspira hampsonii]|uniref:Chemotaxis protein n=1 Tax=Brachyspira hampsonii TaxID=1287055 RepID=A0AAC9TTU8_9SPIR|nr:methyl-accepting chemotaxis protein [Brachyspira hampsonii]ASJ20642.1 chemotaxis protein [Brachyspira hampsonii]ELV06780.1 methyl-accepting chemotaxis sensory transducer with Cache sensor [Brachyspira hampsonii 30599]MBW5380432.1 methyl-accepting chemotaxis protein [Brachyspira hampsonii]MBW5409612.1 methyl-accepting chemotaxis protein [Brachyspira hampsonii]OEJ18422.1 chemotaxis protein [Brachyspira hampsonii]
MKINNLSFRIPFIISITFILCMFIIVLIITIVSSNSIEDTAIKGLRVAAKSYSDMIDLYFSEKRLVMDLYSKDPNLSRYLVNPTEENKLAAEESLKEFTREVSDTQVFYNYSLVNFDANIILDSIGGKLLHINYGKNSSDWTRFRDTGYDFAGRDLIQPSSANPLNAICVIWKGVKDENGKVVGVLNSSINWMKFISDYITPSQLGRTGSITIIDKNKNIIAHNDTNKLYIYESNIIGTSAYERKPETIREREDKFFQYVLDNKEGILEYVDDNNVSEISLFNPINNTPWYLIVSYSQDEIYGDKNKLTKIVIIIAIVMSVIICFIGKLIARSIILPLNMVVDEADNISNGHIANNNNISCSTRKDEIGVLMCSFYNMKLALMNAVNTANSIAADTKNKAGEISSKNNKLHAETENNSYKMQETSNITNNIGDSVLETTNYANELINIMKDANNSIDMADNSISEAADNANSVSEASNKIKDITKVIENIAFQTNILALNASVEAARAGENGRGFSVVANEVRNLAQSTSGSVKDISSLIEESQKRIELAAKSTNQSKELFNDMKGKLEKAYSLLSNFSSALKLQKDGIDSISSHILNMEDISRNNTELAEDVSEISEELEELSIKLEEAMSFFKIKDDVK